MAGGGAYVGTLDNLKNVFIDVLEGMPFDTVFPLPGRDRRKPSERTHQKHEDMLAWVNHVVRSGRSQKTAFEEAGRLFGMEPDSVKKTFLRVKKKVQ